MHVNVFLTTTAEPTESPFLGGCSHICFIMLWLMNETNIPLPALTRSLHTLLPNVYTCHTLNTQTFLETKWYFEWAFLLTTSKDNDQHSHGAVPDH